MSHHNQTFLNPPSSLQINPRKQKTGGKPKTKLTYADNEAPLLVEGQGVLSCALNKKQPFYFLAESDDKQHAFKLEVNASTVIFYELVNGNWVEQTTNTFVKNGSGIDPDDLCHYWFSIDSHNRFLRYGKGEVRRNTQLAELSYPPAPEDPKDKDPYAWVAEVDAIAYTPDVVYPEKIYRDPVIQDPAMVVVSTDKLTMDDIAANRATVAANLTPTCRQLYENVAGTNFQLNTADFPDFARAIEASIASPQGWCNKKLKEKSTEFGGQPNPDETYLRITMGFNQGDSPGIPYVMEIWPPGHYSPVHNHAEANAIIRVLHGEITVNLYPMLSDYHLMPFMVAKFAKDDVTWISPDLNQTHQLHNTNVYGPTCITIQCYMYGDTNTKHYGYFDYLNENGQIEQFTPNSDMDFLAFKEQMKYEWIHLFNAKG